jgi:uncharacterized protein (TIGR03083 family)
MTIPEHVAVVAAEGRRFAAAARRDDLNAPVAGCPGWSVRDLVRHLGEIHLWAAANVAGRPGARLDLDDRSQLVEPWPELALFWPEDGELIDWYLLTNANLVHVLESAPPDVAAPTFLPAPSPLAMWARRQAHETSIHRYDAEQATGATTGYDPRFAADGVDELLYGFYERVDLDSTRVQSDAGSKARHFDVDHPRIIRVLADDTGDSWYMRIEPRSISADPAGGPIDLTVTGTASDLYTALWNRGDDTSLTTVGERRLLQLWHSITGVRWDLD